MVGVSSSVVGTEISTDDDCTCKQHRKGSEALQNCTGFEILLCVSVFIGGGGDILHNKNSKQNKSLLYQCKILSDQFNFKMGGM